MAFKTIVTVIRGEPDGERILEALAPVIRAGDSHVIGVHAETTALAYMPVVGAEAASYDEAIVNANRERMEKLREWFNRRCERDGISYEFRSFENFMGDSAVSAVKIGLAADLIVAQQTDPGDVNDVVEDLEALLFETGRPLLLIPYTHSGPLQLAKVTIAWKESRESTRAIFDSLPLLKEARKVELLVVDAHDTEEHSGMMTAADIANALDRHGIAVTVENQTSGGIPVSAAIENWLSETGADLLVMGAYSRPRLSERLFGGVTKTLLQSMTTPTLMSR